MSLADLIYRAITYRSPATEPKTVPRMMAALVAYTGGTKGAAAVLGVSQRTVQRWAKGTQRPTPGHLHVLQVIQRRLRLPPKREAMMRSRNTPRVWVRYASEDRTRVLDAKSLDWDTGGVGRVIDAFLKGSDYGAVTAFYEAILDLFYREAIKTGMTGAVVETESDPAFIVEKIQFQAK